MSIKDFFLATNQARFLPGSPDQLGATVHADGVNFALYSEHAKRVQLLIFEQPTKRLPTLKVDLNPWKNRTGHVWHIFVKDLPPGARYAYRVAGKRGYQFKYDVKKVLLDPWAKGIDWRWYQRSQAVNKGDNLETSLRGVITGEANPEPVELFPFDWRGTQAPHHAPSDLIIYELHPKGFTAHPNSGASKKGYFYRLKEKLAYLKGLGINAIELMPIQAFDNDQWQTTHWGEQLTNYWGYSTLSYFALHKDYFASSQPDKQAAELKEFVRACHSQGIAVLMDVVYNHTTEGNENGPNLSFRGLDNPNYYLTSPDNRHYYLDFTGCGHTVNANSELGQRLIIESLEYFAREFRIDGFRFDLAACFYYNSEGYFMAEPPILQRMIQSPVLADKYLIAEPWEATGHNLLGSFGGMRWQEWNGKFRDLTRQLIVQGEMSVAGEWAEAFWGETPVFLPEKNQAASVNFVTCHDGFTMWDLLSYSQKHNEANGYDNQDGSNDNFSSNTGAEGPTDMPAVNMARARQMKNLFTILLLSKGAVMLNMGDEVARSQGGNNNAFNQDNLTSYFDWTLPKTNAYLYEFVQNLIKLRQKLKLGQKLLETQLHWLGTNQGQISQQTPAPDQAPSGQPETIILTLELKAQSWLAIILNPGSDPHWTNLSSLQQPGLVWKQIIDTNNTAPDDFISADLAEPLTNAQLFMAPQSLKVLIAQPND